MHFRLACIHTHTSTVLLYNIFFKLLLLLLFHNLIVHDTMRGEMLRYTDGVLCTIQIVSNKTADFFPSSFVLFVSTGFVNISQTFLLCSECFPVLFSSIPVYSTSVHCVTRVKKRSKFQRCMWSTKPKINICSRHLNIDIYLCRTENFL